MADNPITGLSTFTTYSTADVMEIVDVSDTTYAPSGTNKKVTFQNLLNLAGLPAGSSGQIQINNGTGGFGALSGPVGVVSGGTGLATLTANAVMLGEGTSTPGFATIGTAGRLLTDNGSGADPTFQAPVGATTATGTMASGYTPTTSMANVLCAMTLPTAGTYLLFCTVRTQISVGTAANSLGAISVQFFNTTTSAVVGGSFISVLVAQTMVAGTVTFNGTASIGPYVYTVAGATVINVQAKYDAFGYTITNQLVQTCTSTAVRIA
jgi:hypothetical protein